MTTSLPSVSTRKPQIQPLEKSYLQYGYLSPENIPDRIQANTVHISYLKGKVTAEIRGSSLFQLGHQEINEYFQRLLKTLSARLQGEQPVINAASSELVTQFGTCHSRYNANSIVPLYSDIYETTRRISINRIPSRQLVDQLRALLKDNFKWIQGQFAQILRREGRMIVENVDLDNRDSSYLQYSLLKPFSMLFPKGSATLKTIYASLLEIKWLEYDQRQLTGYLEKRGSLFTKSLSPKQPSKYDELFKSQDRFAPTPHGRLKTNLRYRLHLQDQVSNSFYHTFLFQVGKQEDNDHFQELFKSFFAQARGVEPLVKAAAEILISRFGYVDGYADVCEVYEVALSEPIYRSGNGEYGSGGYTQTHTTHIRLREEVLQELHHLIEKSHGLKRRFLEALRQEGRMLTEGLKVTDRDYSDLRAPDHLVLHYPVKFYGYLFSRCQEKLEDIFTKLLVTAWLEEDSKELSVYLGLTQPVSEELPDLPLAFMYYGQAYGVRNTKPDGTCALHALLGEVSEGEYCYQGDIDVREVFIEKIEAKKTELSIQELLHDILIDHLNAGDPSSQMLFKGLVGQRLKQAHHDLSEGFKERLGSSKQTESELWIQELGVLRGNLLHEARKSSRYDGMTDLEIIGALQENTTFLLDIIIPEKRAFLALINREKQGRIQEEHNKQNLILNQWYQGEKAFILTEAYPHYLTLLANPDFYLNTQEIALAALLFNKKAQVLNSQGTATEVIHRELESEPVLIYHEGCHFSRCTPCSREETTRLKNPQEVLKSQERRQDAQDYMEAKALAEHQRRKDQFALQRLNLSLKEEASQLIISGGLSAMTSNPLPILMQLSRTLINSSGSYIDPLNESGEVQFLKLLGNSGFVRLLGGNMLQIGTSLTVDLVSLATRPKELSRGNSAIRNFGIAGLKGMGTLDEKKFIQQILGALVSEASQTIIPEAQESDIWEERLVRALFTNADIQGAFVDHMVEGMLKKEPKPKVSESLDPEEQAKYSQQVPSKDSEKQETPLPNPEIQRLLDDAVLEHSKEDAIYKDKQLGTKEAKEHRDDKHQSWDKQWKHGTRKEEKKAWGKYEGAKTKVADAVELESKHKAIVDGLSSTIEALKEKLYTPIAEKAPKELQSQNTEKNLPKKNTPVSSAPDRSHLLDSQPSPVGLRIEVVAEKESTGHGGYNVIYHLILHHEGHTSKDIGKFTSKSKALGAAEALNSLSRQIDTQNQESYRLQAQYEALGLNPKELPTTLHFKQMYFEIEASKEKVKLYLNGQKVFETKDAGKALDILKQKGAQQIRQNNQLLGTYKNIVGERAPVHIEAPKGHLAAPIDSKDSKYHHLSYIDAQGKTQTLGKYQKGDDANLVASGWAHFQVTTLSQETQMFDAQKKLASQGIPIEEIPPRPPLATPTIDGTNSDKNFGKIQAARVRNEKTVQAYLQKLEGLAKEPLNPQGLAPSEIRHLKTQMIPKIKDPKEHGSFYKAYRKPGQKLTEFKNWTDEKGIQVSGGEVGRTTFDLYQMKQPQSASYNPGSYGIPQSPTQTPPKKPQWAWQDTQAHQTQQIFEMNMAYQSPSQPTSAPLDYSWMVPEGMTPNYQLPSTDLSSLGRNSSPSMSPQVPQRPLQLAGLVPYIPGGAQSDPVQKLLVNDFTKSVPKGPMKIATAIMSLMLPDMSDIKGAECPKAHFKRVANNVFQKYDNIVEIQNPNGFSARAGEFVGEMIALGGIGKVIRVAEGISIFGMACEGGFIGGVIAEAHDTNKVAGVAFGFAGGAGTGKLMKFLFRTQVPQPLIDRALTMKPEVFSQEIRAIEAMQQPFYRSGVVSEKTAMKLAERSISKIEALEIKASNTINRSKNYTHITFVENGQTKSISMGDMSHAGTFMDRQDLSKAGRALQKKSSRLDSVFPKPTGTPEEVNAHGQRILDEILNHPDKQVIFPDHLSKKFGSDVVDIVVPKKGGARFTRDGKTMIGFLEP